MKKFARRMYAITTMVLLIGSVVAFGIFYMISTNLYYKSVNSADYDYLTSIAMRALGGEMIHSSEVIIDKVDARKFTVRYSDSRYIDGVLVSESDSGLVVIRQKFPNIYGPICAGIVGIMLFWTTIVSGIVLGTSQEAFRRHAAVKAKA